MKKKIFLVCFVMTNILSMDHQKDTNSLQNMKIAELGSFLSTLQNGRSFLLRIRASEIALDEHLSNISNSHIVTTSSVYNLNEKGVYSGKNNKLAKDLGSNTNHLAVLARGIVRGEFILTSQELKDEYVSSYEHTRNNDIGLLQLIVKHDTLVEIDLNDLLLILEKSHNCWPPKNTTFEFTLGSGYTLLKDIIQERKKRDETS